MIGSAFDVKAQWTKCMTSWCPYMPWSGIESVSVIYSPLEAPTTKEIVLKVHYKLNNNNNNNNNNTRTIFMVLTSWLRVIGWVHLVHAMNAEQRQTAADLWTKPTDLSHWPACIGSYWNYIHHHHLLLLSPKAERHLTIPQSRPRWMITYSQTVYLPASSHPSKL